VGYEESLEWLNSNREPIAKGRLSSTPDAPLKGKFFVHSSHMGGRCINVTSYTLVEKLQLTTVPHPTPYTIQ